MKKPLCEKCKKPLKYVIIPLGILYLPCKCKKLKKDI